MSEYEQRVRDTFPVGTRVCHMDYSRQYLRSAEFRGWPVTGYEHDSQGNYRVVLGDTRYLPEDLAIVPDGFDA